MVQAGLLTPGSALSAPSRIMDAVGMPTGPRSQWRVRAGIAVQMQQLTGLPFSPRD